MISRIAIIASLAAAGLLSACAPQKLPDTKVGKPYVINGQTYYPAYDPGYDKTGEASWYGPGFHGKYTASGETYDQHDLTAAHPTLPMPSLVRVTNLENGKSAVVRVNDRGPFAGNRIIDLSKASAKALGIHGVARVRVQFLEKETEEYISLAKKENGGRVIPMAEYNQRLRVSDPALQIAEAKPASGSMLISDVYADEPPAGPPEAASPMPPAEESVAETSVEPIISESISATESAPQELSPSAAPKAISAGAYAVQLGSFSAEENAHKLAAKIASLAEASIEQVSVRGKPWWRVRVGGFERRDLAEAMAREIRAAAPDARVVRQ